MPWGRLRRWRLLKISAPAHLLKVPHEDSSTDDDVWSGISQTLSSLKSADFPCPKPATLHISFVAFPNAWQHVHIFQNSGPIVISVTMMNPIRSAFGGNISLMCHGMTWAFLFQAVIKRTNCFSKGDRHNMHTDSGRF